MSSRSRYSTALPAHRHWEIYLGGKLVFWTISDESFALFYLRNGHEKPGMLLATGIEAHDITHRKQVGSTSLEVHGHAPDILPVSPLWR